MANKDLEKQPEEMEEKEENEEEPEEEGREGLKTYKRYAPTRKSRTKKLSPEEMEVLEKIPEGVINKKYYLNFPRIIGEICEFCGVHYSKCPHWKKYADVLTCMCNAFADPNKRKQLKLLYIPHRKVFICDTDGCARRYEKEFGGWESTVCYHLWGVEGPYSGTLLPEPEL